MVQKADDRTFRNVVIFIVGILYIMHRWRDEQGISGAQFYYALGTKLLWLISLKGNSFNYPH